MLWWIRGWSRSFKSFVANRAGEIQTGTDPRQWRFVPTDKNPADLFTRLELLEQANNEKWPFWCKKTQSGLPKKSKPLPLQPLLDEEGQIRCDSRLRYAEFLSHDSRFPKILPRRHQVTKLIVEKYYEDGNNASGANQTLASLSTQIWIVAGRDEIREWEKECNECRRRKAKAARQIMALLIASIICPNSCGLWRTFSHNPGKSVLEVKTVPKAFHLLSPKGGSFGDGLRMRL